MPRRESAATATSSGGRAAGVGALGGRSLVIFLVLLTLSSWGIAAITRSLWLDEFHVLNHVRKPDFAHFLGSVREDNHPPWPLFLTRVSRAVFGEGPLALRLPSLLAGAILLVIVIRFLRGHREFGRPAVTLALILASPGLLAIMSEARMYSWALLAVTGLWMTAQGCIQKGRPAWPAALWVAVGLHSHYFAFYYVAGIGLTAVLIGWQHRRRLGRLLVAIFLGTLSFIPWLQFGFLHQLSHGVNPGQTLTAPSDLAAILLHLVFVGVGSGGAAVRTTVYLACPLVVVATASGLLRLLSGNRFTRGPGPWLAVVGLVVPIGAWAMAVAIPRLGFGWRYVMPSTVPVLLILAAGARGVIARVILSCIWATMLTLTVITLTTHIREDNRAAVRFILESARPHDLVLIDSTWCAGSGFRTIVWDYYAERMEGLGPDRLRVALLRGHRGLVDAPTVFVFTRFPMSNYRVNDVLRRDYPPPEGHSFGLDRTVLVYRQ